MATFIAVPFIFDRIINPMVIGGLMRKKLGAVVQIKKKTFDDASARLQEAQRAKQPLEKTITSGAVLDSQSDAPSVVDDNDYLMLDGLKLEKGDKHRDRKGEEKLPDGAVS